MKGILAKKIGMTRILRPEEGTVVPVTLLSAPENVILQVKTLEKDGYSALVLGAFERKRFGKNPNKQYQFVQELCDVEGEFKKGDKISLDSLKDVPQVKITSISKGKGFAGVMRRYNFGGGKDTHGSTHHREPGSVGTCAKPGRILRGKKMPGQMGNKQITLRSVEVVEIDAPKNLIAVKGAVPGAINSFVFLCG